MSTADERREKCPGFNLTAITVDKQWRAIEAWFTWKREQGMTGFHVSLGAPLMEGTLTEEEAVASVFHMLRRDLLGEYEVVDHF